MGTWGSGSLENDDAADFAIEFESEGSQALHEAFDISETEYLEAPQAQRAVAAAEILAMVRSADASEAVLTPELYDAIQRHASDILPHMVELRRLALAALNRVEADQSELRQLWEEGDADEWTAALTDLRMRLMA
jgi:hypothetical protein